MEDKVFEELKTFLLNSDHTSLNYSKTCFESRISQQQKRLKNEKNAEIELEIERLRELIQLIEVTIMVTVE